ncbi:hypothetical protein G9A89_018247 [Geosiphon pyriformis]|nr:hypothetical protein G9A89_018247 [Geosiphon pyriformis]
MHPYAHRLKDMSFEKSQLGVSTSKRKKRRAQRLDKVVSNIHEGLCVCRAEELGVCVVIQNEVYKCAGVVT